MKTVKFDNTIIVRIDKGEEIIKTLTEVCQKNNVTFGTISGIGSTDHVILSTYDLESKQYYARKLEGRMEIVSLNGNVTRKGNETYLHLHISVADSQCNVLGGHLNECYTSTSCEVIITKINGFANRCYNEETGLNILDFNI